MYQLHFAEEERGFFDLFFLERELLEQAQVDKELFIYASNLCKRTQVADLEVPRDFVLIKKETDKATNFKGVAFRHKRKNEISLCLLGTEVLSLNDHKANFQTTFGAQPSKQMLRAERFFKNVKSAVKFTECKFRFIGHSEGGSEAIYLSLKYNCPAITFNAYGINPKLIKNLVSTSVGGFRGFMGNGWLPHIVNFKHPRDIVSRSRKLPGVNYIVPTDGDKTSARTGSFVRRALSLFFIPREISHCIHCHRIVNFGDCTNAVRECVNRV